MALVLADSEPHNALQLSPEGFVDLRKDEVSGCYWLKVEPTEECFYHVVVIVSMQTCL